MKAAVATHSDLIDESYGHILSQAHQWPPTRDYHNHGWPLGALLSPNYTAPQMPSTQEAVRWTCLLTMLPKCTEPLNNVV